MRVLSKIEKENLLGDIKNFRDLRIFSYSDDLKKRQKFIFDSAISSALYSIQSLFAFIFFSVVVPIKRIDLNIAKYIFFPVLILLILIFIYFLIECLNKFLLVIIFKGLTGKYKKRFSLFKSFIFVIIPLEFFWLISLLWRFAFDRNNEVWQYDNWKLNLCVFILSTVMSIIQVYRIFKVFPNYLLESINNLIFYFLAISSIVTLIYGPQIISPENMFQLFTSWGLVLIIGTVVIISMKLKNKSKKNNNIAQKIFEVQLLSNNPDYEELKKCYYHGGEKYKEKLLSTEKFLKVIVKNELKSLKDLKTYEDYRLYKAFNHYNYLKLQK